MAWNHAGSSFTRDIGLPFEPVSHTACACADLSSSRAGTRIIRRVPVGLTPRPPPVCNRRIDRAHRREGEPVRIAGVIDADGHVSEPSETWEQYLPSEYHIYAPRRLRDQAGHHRNAVAGELLPYIPQAPEWLRSDRPTGG